MLPRALGHNGNFYGWGDNTPDDGILVLTDTSTLASYQEDLEYGGSYYYRTVVMPDYAAMYDLTSAQTAQANAEAAQAAAESSEASAVAAKDLAEAAQATAEANEAAAIIDRNAALASQASAEATASSALAAQQAAESAQATAETNAANAENLRILADAAKLEAQALVANLEYEKQVAVDALAHILEVENAATQLTQEKETLLSQLENEYTLEEIEDLRAGSTTIQVTGGQATLNMFLEKSSDLDSWTPSDSTSVTIQVDPDNTQTQFFRFRMD